MELQVPVKAEDRCDGFGGGGGRESVPERLEAMERTEPVGEVSFAMVMCVLTAARSGET